MAPPNCPVRLDLTQNDIVIVNGYTVTGYITWGAIWYRLSTLNNVDFQISNTDLVYTEY